MSHRRAAANSQRATLFAILRVETYPLGPLETEYRTMTLRQIALFAVVCVSLAGCEAESSGDTVPAADETASDALGSGATGTNPDITSASPSPDTVSIPEPDAVRHAPDATAELDAPPPSVGFL